MRHELCQGDCLMWLDQLRDEKISCIFADPPDNIGLGYDEYRDDLSRDEYVKTLDRWVNAFVRKADTVWLSFNSKWLLEMAATVRRLLEEKPNLEFKPCVQTFTFGQYRKNDLGNSHRPLWRLRKKDATLCPENVQIPSWRQENGDKRAAGAGKTPSDHFDFTRVTGNSKQRRSWHPTQLNEGLVERCIKLSTQPGDWVVDPFAGTGTTLRVCKDSERNCSLIELDPAYCEKIADEHGMKKRERGDYSRWELT